MQMREYYLANVDRLREQNRENYQQNADQRKVQVAEWNRKNPDLRKQYRRKYEEINQDRVRESKRQWFRDNPEHAATLTALRRSRLRGVESTLTNAEWEAIKQRFDHCCAYCGEQRKLTRDHVIPISKGGSNTADNVVPACKPCNSRKNAGPPPVPVQTMLFA